MAYVSYGCNMSIDIFVQRVLDSLILFIFISYHVVCDGVLCISSTRL